MNTTEQSYADAVSKLAGPPSLTPTWAQFGRLDRAPTLGWKLHLSSTQSGAMRLLEACIPHLVRDNLSFKVARTSSVLAQLNDGRLGATQVGKFITIYPPEEVLPAAVDMLLSATKGFQGPKIVSDLRLGDVLYARYGAIRPLLRRDRLGRVSRVGQVPSGDVIEDTYRVPFVAPEGVAAPFTAVVDPPQADGALLNGRFHLIDNLVPHAKGSVFLAIDVAPESGCELVVVKEARQFCQTDGTGRDRVWRLQREREMLLAVKGLRAPRVIDHFEAFDNAYLVLEHIRGEHLGSITRMPWRCTTALGRARLANRLRQTAEALAALHAAGLAHRDLKETNVLHTHDGGIALLDFEGATRFGEVGCGSFGTEGYTSPEQAAGEPSDASDDVFSVGAILWSTLTQVNAAQIPRGGGAEGITRRFCELTLLPESDRCA